MQAPIGLLTLTTRDAASAYGNAFSDAMALLDKAIREMWPDFERLCFIEFTTGTGPRSRGERRIHGHCLLKGIPSGRLPRLQSLARQIWTARLGSRVWAEEIRDLPAMLQYLAVREPKALQAPPASWHGRRLRPTRGYYHRPLADLRGKARHLLADERRLWVARQRLGSSATPEIVALEAEIARAAATGIWSIEDSSAIARAARRSPTDSPDSAARRGNS